MARRKTGKIDRDAAIILGGPTGREEDPHAEASIAADEIAQPVGGRPRSAVTGVHDAGSGANETNDGLSSTEEMVRREAEDVAPGIADVDPDAEDAEPDAEETPVFDRAEEEHL